MDKRELKEAIREERNDANARGLAGCLFFLFLFLFVSWIYFVGYHP